MNTWYKKMEVKYHQMWQEALASGDTTLAKKYEEDYNTYVELAKNVTE